MDLIKEYLSETESDDSQTPNSTSEGEDGLFTVDEIISQMGFSHLKEALIQQKCLKNTTSQQQKQAQPTVSSTASTHHSGPSSAATCLNQDLEVCSSLSLSDQEQDYDSPDWSKPEEEDLDKESSEGESNSFRKCSEDRDTKISDRGRKRKRSNESMRATNKQRRMEGKSYLGFRRSRGEGTVIQDVNREQRKMKDSCHSESCKKSKVRKCDLFLQPERENIFDRFWSTMTWDQRKVYVANLVDLTPTQRKTKISPSPTKRQNSLHYHLNHSERGRVPVCKKMFLNTLALGEWSVVNWVTTSSQGMHDSQLRKNQNRKRSVSRNQEDSLFLEYFLESLNKLPSHYCRKETEKQYLEQQFSSLSDLYKAYLQKCKEENKSPVSRNTLISVFNSMNLALFRPRKDAFDMCCSYEAGNIEELIWKKHYERKDRARDEKSKDKDLALNGKCQVLTMDLQAVKTVPRLNASALYYKTKLTVHNFTVYNLATKHVLCYWFDETQGDLSASTFASFIINYMECHLNETDGPIIIYSDGCTFQNRNSIMSNALLSYAIRHKRVVVQKFLEKGHTQMECDSVHAAIETNLRQKDLYLPSDLLKATKEARTKPFPYEVRDVRYTFFKNYSEARHMRYPSIRPGNRVSDPVVTDLRVLYYDPDGTIKYATDFDSELQDLPRRPKVILDDEVHQLHKERLPIKKKKYDHLQQMKPVLPSSCWEFYENIPFNVE